METRKPKSLKTQTTSLFSLIMRVGLGFRVHDFFEYPKSSNPIGQEKNFGLKEFTL